MKEKIKKSKERGIITMEKQKLRKNKGITLIALVITIIVLLILAGITITTLTGENGILNRAKEAKNKTEEAQEKESLELAVISSQMEDVNTLEIDKKKLENAIKQQFGNNKDFSVTDNEDGSFLVSMNDTQRMYYIDETGEIIDQSKMLKISTADELKAFRDDVNSGNTYEGWYVYLANDITLDINEEWEPIGLYPVENTSPADKTNKPFKGVFDGNKHEVNGIYINTSNKVQGLFGLVIGGKILNLGIGENCSINGGIGTAGLVGYLYDGGSVVKCYNKSNIIGDANLTAGIVGQISKEGLISQCYNSGSINSTGNYIGGICGNIDTNSIVEKCYNIGTVNSLGNYIGGICGYAQIESRIQDCYNSGQIIGEDCRVAGICGENLPGTIIQNCYNTGDITGKNELVGGITSTTGGKISNCYNVGNIMGETKIGGISGEAYKSSSTDSNTGIINNTYLLEGTSEKICGFIGSNVKVEDSSIKTEQEIKNLASTLGSAFKEDRDNINNGYPIFTWQ